jgi:hypothetical protein
MRWGRETDRLELRARLLLRIVTSDLDDEAQFLLGNVIETRFPVPEAELDRAQLMLIRLSTPLADSELYGTGERDTFQRREISCDAEGVAGSGLRSICFPPAGKPRGARRSVLAWRGVAILRLPIASSLIASNSGTIIIPRHHLVQL